MSGTWTRVQLALLLALAALPARAAETRTATTCGCYVGSCETACDPVGATFSLLQPVTRFVGLYAHAGASAWSTAPGVFLTLGLAHNRTWQLEGQLAVADAFPPQAFVPQGVATLGVRRTILREGLSGEWLPDAEPPTLSLIVSAGAHAGILGARGSGDLLALEVDPTMELLVWGWLLVGLHTGVAWGIDTDTGTGDRLSLFPFTSLHMGFAFAAYPSHPNEGPVQVIAR